MGRATCNRILRVRIFGVPLWSYRCWGWLDLREGHLWCERCGDLGPSSPPDPGPAPPRGERRVEYIEQTRTKTVVNEPKTAVPAALQETMKQYPRPAGCPEPRCMPVFQRPSPPFLVEPGAPDDRRQLPPGESMFCWGCMAAPVTFTYDGVEHTNDLSACVFTPLKGVIRFQENENDWWLMQTGYGLARRRLGLLFPERFPGAAVPDAPPKDRQDG
jgi:hypothetical protein